MKKDKYSFAFYSGVLKYLQESRKSIYLVAAIIGVTLTFVPVALAANPSFKYSEGAYGKSVNAVNGSPYTGFAINSTLLLHGTTRINLVGIGGYDTFNLTAGDSNASIIYTATGSTLVNNTFNIVSGNGTSTFSMISGPFSKYTIVQNNNGTAVQSFVITGGVNSTVSESSAIIVGSTYYSINLGDNSSVVLASTFFGSATTVNVVF